MTDYDPKPLPTKRHKESSIDQTPIDVPPLRTGIGWTFKALVYGAKFAKFAVRQWVTKTGKGGILALLGVTATGATAVKTSASMPPWWAIALVVLGLVIVLQNMFLRDKEAKKEQDGDNNA